MLLIGRVNFDDLRVNDIIAFHAPSSLLAGSGSPSTVVHRVVQRKIVDGESILVTKGDNAALDPFTIARGQVAGRLVTSIPLIGRPFLFLGSPRFVIFISIAILLSLVYVPVAIMMYVMFLRGPKEGPELSVLTERQQPDLDPRTVDRLVLESLRRLLTEQELLNAKPGSAVRLIESPDTYRIPRRRTIRQRDSMTAMRRRKLHFR